MPFSLRKLTRNNFIALSLLAVVAIAGYAINKRLTTAVVAQQKAAAPVDTKPKDVDVLVPTGIPLGLGTTTVGDSDAGHQIKTMLSNKHANKIESLSYATYEFDPAGNLVRVEGGTKQIDLSAGKTTELVITPSRRSKAENRVMLALEKATGDKESWSASFTDLAAEGANKIKGKDLPTAGKKDKDKIEQDFASGFCVNGYRRAMQLSEIGEKTPPTSFTCDQTERAYAFTFTGKALVK